VRFGWERGLQRGGEHAAEDNSESSR